MKQNGFWKGFGSGLVLTVLIAALCVTATRKKLPLLYLCQNFRL